MSAYQPPTSVLDYAYGDEMKKQITKRAATTRDFLITWAVIAAAIAMPFAEGGMFNLANYVVLLYGWVVGAMLLLAMFTAPIEKLTTANMWQRVITDLPRIAAIALLVYSGFYLHASLLVACWLFALVIVGITKSAYEEQQAET